MGLLYKTLIRPILFQQDPEIAQEWMAYFLKTLGKISPLRRILEKCLAVQSEKPIKLWGIQFPNPVGMAAGLDKTGLIWPMSRAMGFGFAEIGTLTHIRQPGNARPRLFFFPEEKAIVSRTGFNNEGAETLAGRLTKLKKYKQFNCPLGINIGLSRTSVQDNYAEDLLASFYHLADFADYITLNLSTPTAYGFLNVFEKSFLKSLLLTFLDANKARSQKMGCKQIPVLVKISSDLAFPELSVLTELLIEVGIDGVVCSNPSTQLPTSIVEAKIQGAISGKPLFSKVFDQVKFIHIETQGRLPIIAAGGIMDAESAGKMIDAGASLIQVYTALTYEGPFFPRTLAKALSWYHKEWI